MPRRRCALLQCLYPSTRCRLPRAPAPPRRRAGPFWFQVEGLPDAAGAPVLNQTSFGMVDVNSVRGRSSACGGTVYVWMPQMPAQRRLGPAPGHASCTPCATPGLPLSPRCLPTCFRPPTPTACPTADVLPLQDPRAGCVVHFHCQGQQWADVEPEEPAVPLQDAHQVRGVGERPQEGAQRSGHAAPEARPGPLELKCGWGAAVWLLQLGCCSRCAVPCGAGAGNSGSWPAR